MTDSRHAPLRAALEALTEWHGDAFDPDYPDRQARARLRRIKSIDEVQSEAGLVYFQLKREVDSASDGGSWQRAWMPFVAGLLPYVKPKCSVGEGKTLRVVDCRKEHKGNDNPYHRCRFTLGKQLGKRDQPRVSSSSVDLRFRRLIAHEELDDDFRLALVRALRLVKGEVCLWCLARDLRWWHPPKNPNKTYTHPRQEWAADYYPTLLKDTPADA